MCLVVRGNARMLKVSSTQHRFEVIAMEPAIPMPRR
jgi:hypothetical protein